MGREDGGRERIFFSVPLFPRNKPASPGGGQRGGPSPLTTGFIHYRESRFILLSHWLYFWGSYVALGTLLSTLVISRNVCWRVAPEE